MFDRFSSDVVCSDAVDMDDDDDNSDEDKSAFADVFFDCFRFLAVANSWFTCTCSDKIAVPNAKTNVVSASNSVTLEVEMG